MSKNLKTLVKYFESGTAEGDDTFLTDVFIPFEEYVDVISVPISGPRLLLGNKGAGKSAIIRFFKKQLDDLKIPSLILRPKDIVISFDDDSALGPLVRKCEIALVKSIASKLGSGITGLTVDDHGKKLIEVAKLEGERDDDLIEKMFSVLSPIGESVTGIDFTKMNVGLKSLGVKAIKKAIESSLDKSGKAFYVFVDDTDQIASPSEPNHLNRIWSFLLAARSINEYCSNIKFIITMRDEVWRRLNRDGAGQRDQVDHFRNLTKKINMTDENLKQVINRRLNVALEELNKIKYSPYSLFFETDRVNIPSSYKEYRYWNDFIVKRSRERPRDSIQLIYKLCENALRMKQDKITAENVERVMPIYSEERVNDLKVECDLECPQIKEIIRTFHQIKYNPDLSSFTLSSEETADFLNKLPSSFSIILFGKALTYNNKNDVFSLWRYLHEIGFLNARVSDSRTSKGYRHITSNADPDFVSLSRWNDMQSAFWEIHPAYRDYLIKLTNENNFSFGLPPKRNNRKKR